MAVKRFPHFRDVLEAAAKLRLKAGQLKAKRGSVGSGGSHDQQHFAMLGDRARKAHEGKAHEGKAHEGKARRGTPLPPGV